LEYVCCIARGIFPNGALGVAVRFGTVASEVNTLSSVAITIGVIVIGIKQVDAGRLSRNLAQAHYYEE
jgi:hypothetical protein